MIFVVVSNCSQIDNIATTIGGTLTLNVGK